MTDITAADVVVDALPYIDRDYDDPAVKAQVDALLAAEMKNGRPDSEQYLGHLPSPPEPFKNSEVLQTEYQRITSGRKLPPLDHSRYDIPADHDNDDHHQNDPASAESLLRKIARIKTQQQYQLQRLRSQEQLGGKDHRGGGPATWRAYNDELQALQTAAERVRAEVESAQVAVNQARAIEQGQAEPILTSIAAQWTETTTCNIQIQLACAYLENELEQMDAYEQQLKGGQ
ncbi:hypothetical protein IWQ60_008466 [Tieghemiomyces parasiticus]|uniref:Pre-mRNA-splicing factor SPF27 n=1 Tax=Tieghemiomyces parasiticus TaxID=78921 RepID=A0A9W8DMY6_9FUNG|nr:hypothetical protein IWQ60_008466 [Tieghemiomyces parasiticus]